MELPKVVSADGGRILWGHRGEWLCGFTEGMGGCTSMKAQLKAVHRGLQLAKNMNVGKLGGQLESQPVVGILTASFHGPRSMNLF